MINFLKRFFMYFVVILIISFIFEILFNLSIFFSDPIGVLTGDLGGVIILPLVLAIFFALTAIRKTWTMDRKFFNKNEQRIREQILKFPFHQKLKNLYKLDIKREVMLKGDIKIIEREDSVEIEGPSFYINQLQKEFEIS